MHISEGILSVAVLGAGAILGGAGLWLGVRKLDSEKIVVCGVMSAVFFVGTLIHVPIGPGNAHLILNGLLGIILGWAAFPAIFAALVLQALLFQYGGLTTLGVNLCSMAYPAVLASWIFYKLSGLLKMRSRIAISAFAATFIAVAFSALIAACSLALSSENFITAASLLTLAHLPIMIVEGLVSAFTIAVLARTTPSLLCLKLEPTRSENA